jgi:outer membrane protein TolC
MTMPAARPLPTCLTLLALTLVPAAARAQSPGAATALARSTSPSPAPASAGPLRLTLDDAVARALERGDEMRFPRADVREANGRIRAAVADALPQINGVFSYSRKLATVFEVPTTGDLSGLGAVFANSPFAAKNTWSLDLTARQLVYSGGKVGAALRAAREVRKAADANTRETAMTVRYEVHRAYLDAALAQRVVAIAESSLAQARAHLAQVRLYRREGGRSEYDLLRAEVDAANQEPSVIAARNALTLAQLQLRRLINVPLGQALDLVTPLTAEDGTVPVPVDSAWTETGRPALQSAEAAVIARTMAVRIERGRRWPELYLTSALSHQAYPQGDKPALDQFRRSWDAGARLEFPIFLGLRTEGGIQVARAELERAQAQRDQLREVVDIEIEQARTELARSGVALAARRETVRQARRAYELADVRFGNGLSPQIEVSDARLQYQNAELNEVQATRDYRVALAALEKAVGHPLPVASRPVDAIGIDDTDGKEGR